VQKLIANLPDVFRNADEMGQKAFEKKITLLKKVRVVHGGPWLPEEEIKAMK
jgi:hypothetical protein